MTLLRGIEVLEERPQADLTGARVLLLSGARDPYGVQAPAPEQSLRAGGADLDARTVSAGHELSPEDLTRPAGEMLPKLHGALLKNEQDVALFERLAFMARRQGR